MSGKGNELKLYTNLRVDVSEAGGGSVTLPDPDLVGGAERDRFAAYHRAIMKSFAAETPETDMTDMFKTDFASIHALRKLTEKVSSLRLTIEDVDGKFFGAVTCRASAALTEQETDILTQYSQCLFDEGHGDKTVRCPAASEHGELSVRIWRSKGGFMLTRAQVEKAPWRRQEPAKHTKRSKGGEAR